MFLDSICKLGLGLDLWLVLLGLDLWLVLLVLLFDFGGLVVLLVLLEPFLCIALGVGRSRLVPLRGRMCLGGVVHRLLLFLVVHVGAAVLLHCLLHSFCRFCLFS